MHKMAKAAYAKADKLADLAILDLVCAALGTRAENTASMRH